MTETEFTEAQKKEILEKVMNQVKAQESLIKDFKTSSLEALTKLYNTTSKETLEKINLEFVEAVASTGLSIVEVGEQFYERMNETFEETLDNIPKDTLLGIEKRNLYTAILLRLLIPIEDFESRREEALMHVNFINAALRYKGIKYTHCEEEWQAEDKLVKAKRRELE